MAEGGRRDFLRMVGATTAATAGVRAEEQAPKERLGVGLIGCGARGSHLGRVVKQLGQEGMPVQLAAVCDIYAPRLERAAQAFSAKPYKDSTELLKDAAVDAVIVATPDRLHVHQAMQAVRAGKDIYCEKPLTHWQQLDKLKELVREARRRQTVFQVGAQWVTDEVWRRAGELVRGGAIGKPVHAQTGYFRHGDGGERGMPVEDPNARPGPSLDWEAFQADAPRRPFSVSRFFQWRMYMDYSGGPSTDLYPHPLTRLLKVLGVGFPKSVVALGGKYRYNGERDVPDTFDMLIQYPENLTVAVLGTIANETGLETVIRGTEGTLSFGSRSGFVIQPQQGTTKRRQEVTAEPRFDYDHMRNFLECVRTREKPNGDLELGYRVQVPLIMAMLSFTKGKVAHFDADKEDIRLG
jgi:predicted dehydrogenase